MTDNRNPLQLRHAVHAGMVAVTGWISGSTVHTDSGGSLLRILGLSRFGLSRFATVVVLTACASAGTAGSGSRSSDRVSRAEIASSSAINAYALIERLRPNWLRTPGVASIGGGTRSQIVVVYLDGHRLGGIQSLRTLSVDAIQSMQWLDAVRAATVLNEVGSDPIAGAIIIKTQ